MLNKQQSGQCCHRGRHGRNSLIKGKAICSRQEEKKKASRMCTTAPENKQVTSPKPGRRRPSTWWSGSRCMTAVATVTSSGQPHAYRQYGRSFLRSLLRMPAKGMSLAIALKIFK